MQKRRREKNMEKLVRQRQRHSSEGSFESGYLQEIKFEHQFDSKIFVFLACNLIMKIALFHLFYL